MIGLVVVLCTSSAAAQEEKIPEWSVKAAPTSLVDPFLPSAHLAVAWNLGNNTALQLEGGPIFNLSATSNTRFKTRGYRLRPAVRFYNFADIPSAYVEVMFIARVANIDVDADVQIEATSGATYFQRQTYGVDAQKFALLVNLGGRSLVGGGFLVEYAIGVGAALRTFQTSGIPDNGRITATGLINPWRPSRAGERLLPEIGLYVNFGKAITYLPED